MNQPFTLTLDSNRVAKIKLHKDAYKFDFFDLENMIFDAIYRLGCIDDIAEIQGGNKIKRRNLITMRDRIWRRISNMNIAQHNGRILGLSAQGVYQHYLEWLDS